MTEEIRKNNNDKQRGISQKYALCLADVSNLGTRTFSYLIPDRLRADIKEGQAVSVPFGFRKQNITAFIAGFSDYLEEGIKAKEITDIIDKKPVFYPGYLTLLDRIANYYACDINTVIQSAIPMKFLKENASRKEKTEKYVSLVTKENAPEKRLRILDILEKAGKTKLTDFEKTAKTTRATLLKMQNEGFIEISEENIYRNPAKIFKNVVRDDFPELSEEQKSVFKVISDKMDKKTYDNVLIKGITGSGKTEIYFAAIKKALNDGKNVLFLAPEIALVSQLTLRLIRRFGEEEAAIWHSSISEGEKFDVWNRIRDGKIRIIIGARSAIFAPLDNIGLVIIDEEHENTYKQIMPAPRYDARTVAEMICEANNALLIKGSATPDVSSCFKAVSTNSLLTLNKRFNDAKLAKVKVIDMKNEFYKGSGSIFSNALINSTIETLSKGKQAIYLINRRGFYTSIICRDCGEPIKCPDCDIPMVYHASDNTIKCHWCNRVEPMPKTCPHCGSSQIKSSGAGTQRIEETAKKLFPNAKIERIDSDVLSSKTKYIEILDDFEKGKTDILIGTQIIAKGLDNKNVTLVGVLDADINFAFPDFRSAERGFRLLMQSAGRAGRGEFEGEVIFQTHNPDLYAIQNAKAQNYDAFYKTEIERREMFDYPPFCGIIKYVFSGKDEDRVFKCTSEVAEALKSKVGKLNISEYQEISPALPCLMHKINGEYRYQIIIKNKLGKKGHYLAAKFAQNIKCADDIKFVVDIDPVDII